MDIDILILILQSVLIIKLFSVAFSHGVRRGKDEMREAAKRMGNASQFLLIMTALISLILAIILILPLLISGLDWLLVVTSFSSLILFSISILFHRRSRENPRVSASLILMTISLIILLFAAGLL